MAIATATSLDVHVGGKLLFEDVSFKLEPRERMTLSGRNGAGKSTLLRILAGELAPDAGTLGAAARRARRPARPAAAARIERHARRVRLLRPHRHARGRGGAGAPRGGRCRATPARRRWPPTPRPSSGSKRGGGYRWRDRVLAVLRGLGFGPEQAERPLSTFSGGELTRASLARALASGPDLLLLDEPTNHLDIPSLEWLERYLVDLDAAVVLVAHDRWFLEAVGTSVLELEAQRARFFAGPWHAWRKEQAAREIALGKAIERQQAEIERMERFVERFRYKATKARQAQSRVKQIDKIKRDGADGRTRATRRNAALLLRAARAAGPGRAQPGQGAGSRCRDGRCSTSADLEVERGEHVVLVGPNGAGKTTLIETLAGERAPASGSVRSGHNVKVGYLSQHADTAAGEGTVLDAAQRETGLTGPKARALLGGFLFSGADVEKQLDDISGGEQRRLSLAILVASGANVLILDEPTNHLDIESREALEDALTEFEGAVVLVSHDRALLEAVGSRTLVCEDGELQQPPERLGRVPARRDEREAGGRRRRRSRRRRRAAASTARPSRRRRRRSKAARLEEKIERAEAELRAIEEELADPAAWSSPGRAERAEQRHAAAKRAVEELYEQWEAARNCRGQPAAGDRERLYSTTRAPVAGGAG